MTDEREVNEQAGERLSPSGGPQGAGENPEPPAPRGADGESRVVAERSGADTSFPARPLPADPVDVVPAAVPGSAATDREAGDGTPEPQVGPAS